MWAPECLHFKWSWHFLLKEFLGSLVLSQERHHTDSSMSISLWGAWFSPPFATSLHTRVLMVLSCSAICLVEPSHIVPPVDNLKGTRLWNPWLWWKVEKKTKLVNIDGLTQHMQSLPGQVFPHSPQWSGVECPLELSVMTGLFKHLLCPHHGTWPHDTTEHLNCGGCDWGNECFIPYTCRVIFCTAWMGKYFIGQWETRLRGILSCFYPWNHSTLRAHGWEKAEVPFPMAQW